MRNIELYIKTFGNKDRSTIYFTKDDDLILDAGNGTRYSGTDLNDIERKINKDLATLHLKSINK